VTPGASFRVPACRHSYAYDGWSVREFEPLPQFHRPARWNMRRLRQVVVDASLALTGKLDRPRDIPASWRPIHGDLVPWNLREDDDGQLWLLDWEDAGWGPRLADCVRYIVAHHSLGRGSPRSIADEVRTLLNNEPPVEIQEAAVFWLNHRNFRPVSEMRDWPRQKARDFARWGRERAALHDLASDVGRQEASDVLA
jgi:hypothetical protein